MRREYRELIVDVLDRMEGEVPDNGEMDGYVVDLECGDPTRSANAGSTAPSFPPVYTGSGPFGQTPVEGDISEILVR